jgi:hypothetical protein
MSMKLVVRPSGHGSARRGRCCRACTLCHAGRKSIIRIRSRVYGTYDKFEVLRKCKANNGEHTLERIIGVIDSEQGVIIHQHPPTPTQERKCKESVLTQRTDLVYQGNASIRGWEEALGGKQEVISALVK